MAGSLGVAVVSGTFPPDRTGGADFVARFAPALAALGPHVHVITSAHGGPEQESYGDGVTVHRAIGDWTLSDNGRKALRRVNELLRRERADIVHVLFPDSVLQATYQVPAGIGLGRLPLVTTFWNIGLGRRSPLRIKLEAAALLGRSAVLTSHDPSYLTALQRITGWAKPVRWLPVGTNIAPEARRARNAVRRELGLRDAPCLGYFGQLDFTRGIEDLLEALARVRRDGIPARLVMLGGADSARYERYRELCDRLGLEDAVAWTPYLEAQRAAEVLASVDLCVLPYRRNSLGRSALVAALQLGVPTLLAGTPRGVAPLVPGQDVELVPPGDTGRLAGEIARLLGDQERRDRLAAGARKASAHFAWPRIAETALGVYREALEPWSSRRRFRKDGRSGPSAA